MHSGYDGVKFYGRNDLSVGWQLEKAEPIIEAFSVEKRVGTINEILELFNTQELLEIGVKLPKWSDKGVSIRDYQRIYNYDLKVCDTIDELIELITERNEGDGLCRILTGPGWGTKEDIVIQNKTFHWSTKNTDWLDSKTVQTTIVSIHKSQGFDLNYAGVIFGKEVFYDKDNEVLMVDKRELRDNHIKSSGNKEMRQFIVNIYLTLMTRGIKGTYVYAVDKDLQDYLRKYFG